MPGFSGKILADRLQRIKPGIKIINMSGYTGNAIADQGVLSEGTHFISKPFKSSELTGKIRDVLDNKG